MPSAVSVKIVLQPCVNGAKQAPSGAELSALAERISDRGRAGNVDINVVINSAALPYQAGYPPSMHHQESPSVFRVVSDQRGNRSVGFTRGDDLIELVYVAPSESAAYRGCANPRCAVLTHAGNSNARDALRSCAANRTAIDSIIRSAHKDFAPYFLGYWFIKWLMFWALVVVVAYFYVMHYLESSSNLESVARLAAQLEAATAQVQRGKDRLLTLTSAIEVARRNVTERKKTYQAGRDALHEAAATHAAGPLQALVAEYARKEAVTLEQVEAAKKAMQDAEDAMKRYGVK